MNYSETFLRELDIYPHRVVYAKVIALDVNENPVEQIEGQITNGGSINIDGASAVRRTCSFSITTDKVDIHDFYWGYKTKIRVSIGLENHVDSKYPDIIWFEQGTFVITAFSCQLSTSGYTISITAKDKMCLLNGDVGGTLNAQVQFDSIEEETEDGEWKITKFLIKDIIRDSLHQYAGEPYHNIIINDLDDLALELLEYRYDTPMYLVRQADEGAPVSNEYYNATLDGKMECWLNGRKTTISDSRIVYDQLISHDGEEAVHAPTRVAWGEFSSDGAYLAKIEYGDTAGYRYTDLIYPSDLILKVGDKLTSLYDKLVSMLGSFEYFYDTSGRFIFQKKKTYLDTVWLPELDSGVYDGSQEESAYVFSGTGLISAISNSPDLNNLRNDFSVWGARKSTSGSQSLAIHMRYVIEQKPVYYKTYDDKVYYTSDLTIPKEEDWIETDWREIIYQMAKDYNKHNHDDDYSLQIARKGQILDENGKIIANFYPLGRTGYENYYIDLEGFWRQLYYPKDVYVADLAAKQKKVKEATSASLRKRLEQDILSFQVSYPEEQYDENGWNTDIVNAPQNLNFWFNFLDSGELAQYSVSNIGARAKSINDTSINSIYYRDTPNIIFVDDEEVKQDGSGYRFFQVSDYDEMFSISTQGKSAKDEIDSLVYNYSYAQESISITAVPIYYLQPNSRITVDDDKVGIHGDYIVSKITIPLTYNGTMILTAIKAPERLS